MHFDTRTVFSPSPPPREERAGERRPMFTWFESPRPSPLPAWAGRGSCFLWVRASRCTRKTGLVLLALFLLRGVVHADTNTANQVSAISAMDAIKLTGSQNIEDAFVNILNNPDAVNALTYGLTNTLLQTSQSNALLGFINDLNLRPKVFQTKGAADNAVLGLEYNFQKSLANRVLFDTTPHPMGISLTLDASGDVATDASKNPNNLLESGGSLHLFQGIGGISPMVRRDTNFFAVINKAQHDAGEIPPSPNWRDDPRWKNSAQMVSKLIVPQLFYDIAAHGTLESDQQFKNKQYTYGCKVGIVYRDWTDQSAFTWMNLLDYPFAAIRWLTQEDKEFQPSGRAFPVIVGGIDAVDPSSDPQRLNIDPNKSVYPRTRLEVHFRTEALRLAQQDLWFSADFRYYQELGASQAIQNAGLDQQKFFVAKMDLPYKFNISYSIGKLPLDQKNDQVFAVGWAVNF